MVDDRPATPGLHHLTGFVGDPRPAVEFYVTALGLRLVKRTVNFEDRFVHHLYFGDETGSPGSLVTHFAYPYMDPGRVGVPQPTDVALAIPRGTAPDWAVRLDEWGAETERTEWFGDDVVRTADTDGGPVSLVERSVAGLPPVTDAVPAPHAVRGLFGVTLRSTNPFHTAATLEVLGFDIDGQDGDRVRYRAPDGGDRGAVVDVSTSTATTAARGRGRSTTSRSAPAGVRSRTGATTCATRGWSRRGSKTGGTFSRCTPAGRAVSCSRWRPTTRA